MSRELKIVVGPDRHVWLAFVEIQGETLILTRTYNVRYWPKGGLGALCFGPREQMQLDPEGRVEIHWLNCHTKQVDARAWESWLHENKHPEAGRDD